jgi:uncharacterized membrane protein YfcA
LVFRLLAVGLGGFATGFLGGMLGLALGRPRLLLIYWAAENPVAAAGTNILIGSLVAAAGGWRHFREGRVDFTIVAFMGIPTMAGAFLGGFYAGLAPRAVLLVIVGVMSIWYGFKLLRNEGKDRRQRRGAAETVPGAQAAPSLNPGAAPAGAVKPSPSQRLKEMGFGFAIGLFGGFVGLLLGQLRLPAMIHVLGLDPRMAAGTNLAIGFLAGMLGFLGHMLRLQVDWAVFAIVAPAAMVGAYLGAKRTGKMSPRALKRLMGVMMIVVALPLFWVAFTQT